MCGGDPSYKSYGGGGFDLFPACAGVIRTEKRNSYKSYAFPRMCGGDPSYKSYGGGGFDLFPACAGVIP